MATVIANMWLRPLGLKRSAKSPTPHEPPRQRVAHRFAQARRGATEGGSGRSPKSNAGPVADGRKPSLGQPNAPQTASESHWRVSAQIGPTCLRSVGQILSRFLGPRRRLRGSGITSGRHFDATLFPSSKRGSRRPPGLPIGHGQERFFDACVTAGSNLSVSSMCM